MSLKQNGRLVQQMPLRFRGGAIQSFEYQETNKSSLRNVFAGEAGIPQTSGAPVGHLYPSSWLWPQKSGVISSFRSALGSTIAYGALSLGLNGTSSITGTSSLSGTGFVTANMAATINGSSTVTGTATITLNGVCSITSSPTVAATLRGVATASYSSSGVGTVYSVPFATGILTCNITPFTELSPQNLATSVWNYSKTNPTVPSTMKEELQKAKIAAENSFAVSS